MTLSVIIVNYNVQYFLEQCLQSVAVAAEGIDTEVWVVDNNSVDGSVAMVRDKFPHVHLIANHDNPGFAKANNQALKQCTGKYCLLLNPDTVVERDCFRQCIDFMEQHPDCGGLGVKMINGEGVYLKESKRGFPSPKTSFFKISGLIRLFPHHKTIAAYYMGHLSNDEINEIDVLPGAFLMVSKEALNKVGLLDESFFMYGEDIDFSWRIKLAGYKNYYLPTTRIIHYKGESTKKGSMNYVYTFYNAMVIFTKKYFSGGNAALYILLIKLAIWARASLSFVRRLMAKIMVPLMDFAAAYGGFLIIKNLWATYWADNINYYPPEYTFLILPIYVLILMMGSWLYGGYEKPTNLWRIVRGMGFGALILLVFYSLLDETHRYSRAVVLLGSLWTILSTLGIRGLLSILKVEGYELRRQRKPSMLIVGDREETTRVRNLIGSIGMEPSFVGMVSVVPQQEDRFFIGNSLQLSELIRYYKTDEVVFCSKDMTAQQIISLMSQLQTTGVIYKIVPEESDFMVGSNAINSSEDLYAIDLNTISAPLNRRNKRLFDIAYSLILLLFSPVIFWPQQRKQHFFRHCFSVLVGKHSWVGYANTALTEGGTTQPLPPIRKGIFTPCDMLPGNRHLDATRLNMRYAKDYKMSTDMLIVWRNLWNI